MDIEYEAKFLNINKDKIRTKLKEIGAKLVQAEVLQKRVVFELPKGHEIKGGWLRVRDESDKVTMSLKVVDGEKIKNQKEICLEVDNFDEAVAFLLSIGCIKKSYQETKRETWASDDIEITIDEWPFLEPFIEIEGGSEEKVKLFCEKIGFDYSKAIFCSVDTIYNLKYGVPFEVVNQVPQIIFDMENPFKKK
jgi:adenylate cyclase class 2